MVQNPYSRRTLLAGIASVSVVGTTGCLLDSSNSQGADTASVNRPVQRLDLDGTTLRYANLSHVGRVTKDPFEATSGLYIAEYTDAPCFEGGFDGSGPHVAVTSCNGPTLFTDGESSWSESGSTEHPPQIVSGTAYFPGQPIRAVDLESATQQWRTYISTPPVRDLAVSDDLLVQCTHEGLFGVETADGEQRWEASRSGGFTDIVLGEDILWALGRSDTRDDSLVGIAIAVDSGEVQHTIDIDTDISRGILDRDETGPLFLTDGVVRAFNDEGIERWRFGGDEDNLSELRATDGAVYVADSKITYEVTQEEGQERRRWNYGSVCAPAVDDEWLYVASSNTIRRVPKTGTEG